MKNAQTVIKAPEGGQRHYISRGGVGVPSLSQGDGGTGIGITRRHSKRDRGDGRWAGLALDGCFLPCTVICLEWGGKWVLVLGPGFASAGLLSDWILVSGYVVCKCPLCSTLAAGTGHSRLEAVFRRSTVGRPSRIFFFLSSDLGARGVGRLEESRNSFPSSGWFK